MNIVISVVVNKITEFEFEGVTYKINEAFKKMCQKLFTFYVLMIGIICVLVVNFRHLFGVNDIFNVCLLVVVALIIYNILMEMLAKKIIKRAIKR